jgi:hypothetical protein
MRQVCSAAIVGCVLLLVATACGGASKNVSAVARPAGTDWQKTAAAIESRLRGAGYSIYTQDVHGRASAAAAAGAFLTAVQAPLVPPGAPNPRQAFSIQVDWTSPHNFSVQVLLFRSAAEAARAARAIAAESAAACRRFRPQAGAGCLAGRAQQVRGAIVYGAYTVGRRARRDFENVVALAEGRSGA